MFVQGGRFLTIVANSNVFELWDLERATIPEGWPADVRAVAARPDGLQVAALRSTGELLVYDLPSLSLRSRCSLGFKIPRYYTYGWISLSQSGRRLAVVYPGPDLKVARVVDVESGRIDREFKLPTARVGRALALNRTGNLLAIVHDRVISVFDMADGEQLSLLQGHQSEGIVVQFQPSGDLLVSSSWDGTTRLWDPIRGRPLLTLEGVFREWVDGGSSMAVGRGHDLTLCQTAARTDRRTIDCRMLGGAPGAALYGPARVSYSPDGQLLAMAIRPEGVANCSNQRWCGPRLSSYRSMR